MKMDAGLDTGPMLGSRAIPILPTDTGQTLHDKLAALGGPLLIKILPRYVKGEISPQAQDDSKQTYAPMLKKEEGTIDWTQPAGAIERLVRAFDPWPGTFTLWEGKSLKVLAGSAMAATNSAQPGRVFRTQNGVAVATGDGLYVLDKVQLAGRPATATDAFVNGHPDFIGTVLG